MASLLAAGCAAAAIAAAPLPGAFAQVAPGLWEMSGAPGSRIAPRQCFSEASALAQFEHRRHSCSRKLISQRGTTAVIEYSCGGQGFGRSEMTLITPRSLRIQTQGISGGLPFNYVLQARRVGDCPAPKSASRH